MNDIAERYAQVQERIRAAAERAGRDPAAITLVAVTKTWPAETVIEAYRAGLRHFGENRAYELEEKRAAVTAELGPDSGIIWHQIGTLQSRKTKTAAATAGVFHALDRFKIARRLSRHLTEELDPPRILPTFLEVNVSGEESKSGYAAHKWEESETERQKIRKVVQKVLELPGLELKGLMTMAPWGAPEEVARPIFRRTRFLAAWLTEAIPDANLMQLSMGMTDDFEIAIEEGATHIRVGRAIFGERDYH